ncbi:MAG: hypothetical protein ACKO8O_19450, partial [Betaproteobacteria bacterium]
IQITNCVIKQSHLLTIRLGFDLIVNQHQSKDGNGTHWQSASGWQSADDPKTMTGVEHDAERHAMETSTLGA